MADWEERKADPVMDRIRRLYPDSQRPRRAMTLPQLLRYFRARAAMYDDAVLRSVDSDGESAHHCSEAYTDAANCLEASIQAMLKR